MADNVVRDASGAIVGVNGINGYQTLQQVRQQSQQTQPEAPRKTIQAVTYSHDPATGAVVTTPVTQVQTAEQAEAAYAKPFVSAVPQNTTLTPVTYSHDPGTGAVVTKTPTPISVEGSYQKPFISSVPRTSQQQVQSLPTPFVSQVPQATLGQQVVRAAEQNPLVAAAASIPIVGSVVRPAVQDGGAIVDTLTGATPLKVPDGIKSAAVGAIPVFGPAIQEAGLLVDATQSKSPIKSTDIMNQGRSDRLQSVIQAYGAGTDITVGTITGLGGLSPSTAITPFKDLNAKTGLGEQNQELAAPLIDRNNAIVAEKNFAQSYDFGAAEKSLAAEKLSLELTANPLNASGESLKKEYSDLESLRTGLDTTSPSAVSEFNAKVSAYNIKSSLLESSSKDLQKQVDIYNQNVATYGGRVEQLKGLESNVKSSELAAFQAGALEVQNGQLVESPLVERPYGTFSDWSKGASEVILGDLGLTRVQVLQGENLYKNDLLGAFGYGAFKEATLNPGNVVASAISGAQFAAVGGAASLLGKSAVAAAAEGSLPVVSTLGRAASSPIGTDVIKLAGLGAGAAMIGSAYAGKSAEEAGATTLLLGAGALGAVGVSPAFRGAYAYEPKNDFLNREVISGKLGFAPSEIARQDISAYLNSFKLPAEQRAAYRALPEYFRSVRGLEVTPGISETNVAGTGFKSPDISKASTIGPERAQAVGEALAESGTVLKGSIVMESQKSATPLADLYRSPHDLDVIASNKALLESNLAKRGETSAGLDVKDFEPGYAQVLGITDRAVSTEGISTMGWGTRLLGEPIRTTQGVKLPTSREVLTEKDYIKSNDAGSKIAQNQELLTVQFARKSQALMQDLTPATAKVGNVEARAMNEQFRTPKDYYDLQVMGRDIRAMEAIRSGKTPEYAPESEKFLETLGGTSVDFNFMPREDNPVIGAKAGEQFVKTMTLREIREAMESNIKGEKSGNLGTEGETPLVEYPKGIIESSVSASQRGVTFGLPSTGAMSSRSTISRSPSSIPSPASSIGSSLSSESPSSVQSPRSLIGSDSIGSLSPSTESSISKSSPSVSSLIESSIPSAPSSPQSPRSTISSPSISSPPSSPSLSPRSPPSPTPSELSSPLLYPSSLRSPPPSSPPSLLPPSRGSTGGGWPIDFPRRDGGGSGPNERKRPFQFTELFTLEFSSTPSFRKRRR